MAYCTVDDIKKRLPEAVLIDLTDDEDAGEVDTDVVAAAIADADEEIDAYLSMRYALPFSSTPAIVTRLSTDLAVESLYGRRDHLELPKQLEKRIDAARRMLSAMAKGALKLDVPDAAEDSGFGPAASTSKSDRIFTMGKASDGSAGSLDNY